MKALYHTSGGLNPNEHLQRIGLRHMISPTKHGVNLQRGESNPFCVTEHCSLFVGLYQQILKGGYFDEEGLFHSKEFNLVQHPTLPLAVIANYNNWSFGVYLLNSCSEEQYENYKCAIVQNQHYNECEEFLVNIETFR